MNNIMNSIVRLNNGESYVLLNSTPYNGEVYYLGNIVVDNHLGDDIAILKEVNENSVKSLLLEKDLDICKKVIEIFSADAQ